MKKFNCLFIPKKTRVKIWGLRGWWLVDSIHPTRNWIKIRGRSGSFQRGHIKKFTNKPIKFFSGQIFYIDIEDLEDQEVFFNYV
jgi:hypothetical protein